MATTQVLLERLDTAGNLVFGAKSTVTPTDTGRYNLE